MEGVLSARVPVIKLVCTFSGLSVDITLWDPIQTSKTALFKNYMSADDRVLVFLRAIKRWSKSRQVGDASQGFMSQFCVTLMGLFTLQLAGVVPNLQGSAGTRFEEDETPAPHEDSEEEGKSCYTRQPVESKVCYMPMCEAGTCDTSLMTS